MSDTTLDWGALGWRWCARSFEVHAWNVYLQGGTYGCALVAMPPGNVVLPGEACAWHGHPAAVVALPAAPVVAYLLPAGFRALLPSSRGERVEVVAGLGGWASLVVDERAARGWRRAARAAGVEVGATRRGLRGAVLPVRTSDVWRLLQERGARVASRDAIVAADEVAGHEPRRVGAAG